MTRQPGSYGMQHALATFVLIVLGFASYRFASSFGWSWLTLVGLVGICALVLAIYLLRPRWVAQVPLALLLFASPSIVLAWQSGEWKSLVGLAGMLFPLAVVFVAACFAVRATRKAQRPSQTR